MNQERDERRGAIRDLIILGGGCAGLSLAARLAQETPKLRVSVVEPRTMYEEDRTWCGWRLRPHLFADCTVQQWWRWRVVNREDMVERGSDAFPYEMIRSDLFYAKATSLLRKAESCQLLCGLSAISLHETEEAVRVQLSDGTRVEAPWVIDTRSIVPRIEPPWLWQNFVGFVVRGEFTNKESFEKIPTLMDFQPCGDSIARFMYILPITSGLALCEWTQFAGEPGQQVEIEARLTDWIDRHARSGWSVDRREGGSLPMALVSSVSSARVIAAGTRGGSMRASTGYAFHAIQRWAEACTQSLKRTGMPVPPERNLLLDFMDKVFLEVLQQPGRSAAELFAEMFRETPPDSLVRFLAGVPHTKDLWATARSLPWTPFLRALPSALRTQSAQ